MLREHVFNTKSTKDHGFEWRSNEPSRLEGLSDAVIGFAITLLVVSLEVPKSFSELLSTMSGFVAFGISFALLALIWHAQYIWFRRYALADAMTVTLTMLLLFVVLFFVYPLKFFTAFTVEFVRAGGHVPTHELANGQVVRMIESNDEFLQMIATYSAGYAAVFGIFALMYWHAWRKREELDLSDVEEIETRYSILEHCLHLAVGVLAAAVALFAHSGFAMFAFFLIAPSQMIQGKLRSRARKRVEATRAAANALAAAPIT